MPDERPNQLPEEENQNPESFESDTQKIVHRHLENEDDVITEEDIRNIRVGMVPPGVIDTEDEARERLEEEIEETSNDQLEQGNEEEEEPSDNPITPWDMVDEDK